MHERLRMFSDMNSFARKTDPSPHQYEINERQTMRLSRGAGFGYGHKTDFTVEKRDYPGPIYNLSGFTDRFTETKINRIGERR